MKPKTKVRINFENKVSNETTLASSPPRERAKRHRRDREWATAGKVLTWGCRRID